MAYARETILAAMATSAAGITVANGYEKTISQVVRYPVEQEPEVEDTHFAAGAPLLFLFDGDPEETDDEKDDVALWTLRPRIRVLMASTATAPSTAMNSSIGDIKKWIKSNRTSWHTSVVWSRVLSVSVLTGKTKPHAGFDVLAEVKYQTTASEL